MKNTFTALFLLFVLCLQAQPGELDITFADDGIFLQDISGGTDTAHDIIVQPDGKILVVFAGDYDVNTLAFDYAVMRFLSDGTIDTTFGVDGLFHFENPLGSDIPYDMELLDDGSILVAGSFAFEPSNTAFCILKLTPDGLLDSNFGISGVSTIEIDTGLDYARGMDITDEGKIIVCGYSHVPGFTYKRNVLIRLSADGSLDITFGFNGIFMWNDNQTANEMYATRIAPDGGILVSGYGKPGGSDRIAVYKVLEDGSGMDFNFGDMGEILAPVEGKGRSLALHPDGYILVGGNAFNSVTGSNFVILSYNMDGSPNMDFGNDGQFEADADILDYGAAIAIQSDKKIIIVGEAGAGFSGDPRRFATARCDADGILDTSWGGTGIVQTPTSDIFAFPNAIAIQPADGKVLITGASATFTAGNDLTICRYGNFVDADGDGFPIEEDCDDDNIAINPDADEIPYNGLDDDCNPLTPDDDLDGDGFPLAEDCDDENAGINPNAIEIPDNGIDEDCDGYDEVTIGVTENTLISQFKVYPNPAQAVIHIESGANAPAIQFVNLLDAAGRKIKTIQPGASNQLNIALEDLPKGMVIVAIYTSDGVAVKRIIKK